MQEQQQLGSKTAQFDISNGGTNVMIKWGEEHHNVTMNFIDSSPRRYAAIQWGIEQAILYAKRVMKINHFPDLSGLIIGMIIKHSVS